MWTNVHEFLVVPLGRFLVCGNMRPEAGRTMAYVDDFTASLTPSTSVARIPWGMMFWVNEVVMNPVSGSIGTGYWDKVVSVCGFAGTCDKCGWCSSVG